MPWLFARLIGLGVPQRLVKPLLVGLAALLILGAVIAAVKLHDRRVVATHEAKIEQRAAPATNKAAEERANDAVANAKTSQEMTNAIQAQPDQPIAPTSHALSCQRLRRAGKHPASCGGSKGAR